MKAHLVLLVAAAFPHSVRAVETIAPTTAVQVAVLDATRPYFVATHPRMTTTVRFPAEIGAPEGSTAIFSEDASKPGGEYLVNWQQGDASFTLTPLREAKVANLNVPFEGQTYVLYLFPVAEPMEAVAVLNLTRSAARAGLSAPAAEPPSIAKRSALPTRPATPPSSSRLFGFLDRLKIIHAAAYGPPLVQTAKTMDLEVATTREGRPADEAETPSTAELGDCGPGLNDAGLYQIVLLRAVRDARTNCVGFVCLMRNTSDQVLTFDVSSFGARAGGEYLGQRMSDAPAVLQPGEQAPAYFVVQAGPSRPLMAANLWRISVDLVAPKVNPGAAMTQGFTSRR